MNDKEDWLIEDEEDDSYVETGHSNYGKPLSSNDIEICFQKVPQTHIEAPIKFYVDFFEDYESDDYAL